MISSISACHSKGETQCKEGTLSWCSNNIPQSLACPTDCEDANKCKTITKADLTNIPCRNDSKHAKDICIINNNVSQQYECVNNKWIHRVDCPSGCDIAMHLCRCDPDSYKDSKGLRVCDKEHHIIVSKQ